MYRARARACLATPRWIHPHCSFHILCRRSLSVYNNTRYDHRGHSQACETPNRRIERAYLFQPARHLKALAFSLDKQQSSRHIATASIAEQKTTSQSATPRTLEQVAKSYPAYGSYGEYVPSYFHDPKYAQVAVRQALDMLDRHVDANTNLISASDAANVYRTSFNVGGAGQIDVLSSAPDLVSAEQASWAQLFLHLHNEDMLASALKEHNFDPVGNTIEETIVARDYLWGRAIYLTGNLPELTFQGFMWKRQEKQDVWHWLVALSLPGVSWTPIYRSSTDPRLAELLVRKRFEHLLIHHSEALRNNNPHWFQLKSIGVPQLLHFLRLQTSRTGHDLVFDHASVQYGQQSCSRVTMLLNGEQIGQHIWFKRNWAETTLRLKAAMSIIKNDPNLWTTFMDSQKSQSGQMATSLVTSGKEASDKAAGNDDALPLVHLTDTADTSNAVDQISKPLILLGSSINTSGDDLRNTSPVLPSARNDNSNIEISGTTLPEASDVSAVHKQDDTRVVDSKPPLQVHLNPKTLVSMQDALIAAGKVNMLTARAILNKASPQLATESRSRRRALYGSIGNAQSKILKRQLLASSRTKATSPLQKQRQSLPVFVHKASVEKMIRNHSRSIIVGGTGCGKSTQVPQIILEHEIAAGRGAHCNIICTQPRRVAALSLAARVADERNERLGLSVGYQVRHDRVQARNFASITYLTTGLLLEKLGSASEPLLSDVSHIIIDEVHERDVNMDFLMLSLKLLAASRRKASLSMPKIILMSATLEIDLFAKYWAINGKPCPSLTIPGRLFPVERQYLEDAVGDMEQLKQVFEELQPMFPREVKAAELYLDQEMRLVPPPPIARELEEGLASIPQFPILLVIAAIRATCTTSTEGAILVFLPGIHEIRSVQTILETSDFGHKSSTEVLLLHSSLSKEEHSLIFKPLADGLRRIILSTNIAETSLTVPYVRFVIDSGIIRELSYDPESRATTLSHVWQSQSSSLQKMGRAGRLEAGHYLALFTKSRFDLMHVSKVPEMLRTNLSLLALLLKVRSPEAQIGTLFREALQPPEPDNVKAAQSDLQAIGALDTDGALTMLGSVLSKLSLEPRWARIVLLGVLFKCLDAVLIIATSVPKELFLQSYTDRRHTHEIHQQFNTSQSDHLAVYTAYTTLRRLESEQGQAAARHFASENFLTWRAYQTIQKDALAIERRMQACGLLRPETDKSDRLRMHGGLALNINNNDHELIKCLILAGFPNNLAAFHRGSRWTIGCGHSVSHPSSLVKWTAQEKGSRSHLTLRLFTALSEDLGGKNFLMRKVSSLVTLGGLLFCDTLRLHKGLLHVNDLQAVRLEYAPVNTPKLVLEYKKLADRVIGNALQNMGKEGCVMDSDTEDFIQHLVEVIRTASTSDVMPGLDVAVLQHATHEKQKPAPVDPPSTSGEVEASI